MIEQLYTDQPLADTDEWGIPENDLGIRNLMILDQKLARAEEKKQQLLDQITHLYKTEVETIRARRRQVREAIKTGIQVVNNGEPARFPDVGTAYLRETPAKVEVEAAYLDRFSREFGTGREEWKPNTAETKARLLELVKAGGEVPTGVSFVPAGVDVSIRGS